MGHRVHAEHQRDLGPKSSAVLAQRAEVRRDLRIARSLGLTLAQFDRLNPQERDLWVLDWQRKQGECPDCGNPVEECSDPDRVWYPYRRVCYASMELKSAQDAYADLHEKTPYHDGTFTAWNTKRTLEFPYHHSHGVNFGIADKDLTPWDLFMTDRDASPIPPSESTTPVTPETGDDFEGPGSDPSSGPERSDDA